MGKGTKTMQYMLITAIAFTLLFYGCAPATNAKTIEHRSIAKTASGPHIINPQTLNLNNLIKNYNKAVKSKKTAIKKANNGDLYEAVDKYNLAKEQFDKVQKNLEMLLSHKENKLASMFLNRTKSELDNIKRDLALILYFENESEKIFGPKRATVKYIDN